MEKDKKEMYEARITEKTKEGLTLKDFIEICDDIGFPVFERSVTFNPFAPEHLTQRVKAYNTMAEYRKTMPDWSARGYDYTNDCALEYLPYPQIADGSFSIRADNNSTIYTWDFSVYNDFVYVYAHIQFTD